MPDIISVKDMQDELQRSTWLAWAVCELIPKPALKGLGPDSHYTFEVKINGHDVSFRTLVAELQKQYEKQVHDEAVQLIANRLRRMVDQIEDIEGRLDGLVGEVRP